MVKYSCIWIHRLVLVATPVAAHQLVGEAAAELTPLKECVMIKKNPID